MAVTGAVVVTIDGPAGSGKSTVAGKVAKRLGFIHLNSGFLFRAVALLASESELNLGDDEALTRLAEERSFKFELDALNLTRFTVDGRDLTDRIRSEEIGELASKIAVLPKLREVFVRLQRSIAERQSLVVEGRDAGSVVFPGAAFKFYLDAPLAERAARRFRELQAAGSSKALAECQREIEKRDLRDSTREVAPQVCPEGARRVATGELSVEEVVEQVVEQVN